MKQNGKSIASQLSNSNTSSIKQKNELANQKEAMEKFCVGLGYAVDEWISAMPTAMLRKSPSKLTSIYVLRERFVILSDRDRSR